MGLRPTEGNESRQGVVGRGFMPRRSQQPAGRYRLRRGITARRYPWRLGAPGKTRAVQADPNSAQFRPWINARSDRLEALVKKAWG